MKGGKRMMGKWSVSKLRLRGAKQCLSSGGMLKAGEMIRSPESVVTRDYSPGCCSSYNGDGELKYDNGSIEEAESSLREGGCLSDEEARALMGRLEYQRGNLEAALRVFDGIDISAVIPKLKLSIVRRAERHKHHSRRHAAAPMSMHAVSLLFEAMFLKAKSLQELGRFKDAALSCNVVLDTIESALPEGMPENFASDSKLQEIIYKAAELLPELWKLAGFSHEAVISYRRVLLNYGNLDLETMTKVFKEFAIFLLYGCSDVSPPNLRCHIEGSFIPKSNIEEAILLLMILLRKIALNKAQWDPSILDHLTFALSVSGNVRSLTNQVEGLLPGVLERKERYYTLALCYLGEGDDAVALNLLKKILSDREDPNCIKALLLASKICGENREKTLCAEGVTFARRALANLSPKCDFLESAAYCFLGLSLSSQANFSSSDSERVAKHCEALQAFEKAAKLTKKKNCNVVYNLSLENADQRKLDTALHYAKLLLRLEAGYNIKSWILLARILSAQKHLVDAETIVNAALDQTGKWDQGELLRIKAKIQVEEGQLRNAIETYTHLLALLQLKSKSFRNGPQLLKDGIDDKALEMETWNDLSNVYRSMSLWKNAEVCLSKSRSINPLSSSTWHMTGKLYEARGFYKEALGAYRSALEIEPNHVPSLVSTASVLEQLGDRSLSVVRSFLTEALRIDRTNHEAWYHLGTLYKAEGSKSVKEAVECFQAAALLEESAPIEPFRHNW